MKNRTIFAKQKFLISKIKNLTFNWQISISIAMKFNFKGDTLSASTQRKDRADLNLIASKGTPW